MTEQELIERDQRRLEKERKYRREYYARNKERILAQQKRYRIRSQEHRKKYQLEYYLKHLEEISEKKRAYYQRKKAEKAAQAT